MQKRKNNALLWVIILTFTALFGAAYSFITHKAQTFIINTDALKTMLKQLPSADTINNVFLWK